MLLTPSEYDNMFILYEKIHISWFKVDIGPKIYIFGPQKTSKLCTSSSVKTEFFGPDQILVIDLVKFNRNTLQNHSHSTRLES